VAQKLIVCLIFFMMVPSAALADVYQVYKGGMLYDEQESIAADDGEQGSGDSEPVYMVVAGDGSDSGAAPEPATTTDSAISFSQNSTRAIYPVYDDGFISSTYLDWAKGMLERVPVNADYVFARTGQYEYIFACGQLSDTFNSEGNLIEVYSLNIGRSGSAYTYTHFTDSSFSLQVGGGLVYSSIAPYPTLTGSDFSYQFNFLIPFVLCVGFGIWLFSHLFECLRG
jgi:hypothetical protein